MLAADTSYRVIRVTCLPRLDSLGSTWNAAEEIHCTLYFQSPRHKKLGKSAHMCELK